MTLEDIYGKCYLVVVCHSATYKILKVMKLFRKIALKDSGIIFTIVIISLYNYYYYHLSLLSQFLLSWAPRSNQFQRLGVSHYLTVDSTFRKIWAVPKGLSFEVLNIDVSRDFFHVLFQALFFFNQAKCSTNYRHSFCFKASLRKHLFLLAFRRWGRFAPMNVSDSATQRQEFHTDDANQRLHSKSGSHGVPKINLPNFTCLQVDFGIVLCSCANELLQNSNASSREDYIPQILNVFVRFFAFLFDLCGFLSFVCHL